MSCVEKPCKACPYRRDSLPGWLGESTPVEFMEQTMSDMAMPCHLTIDYEDPEWEHKWVNQEAGLLCAGALIFFANICKLSRDNTRPRLPADKTLVFSNMQEFINYHSVG